ncbi:jg12554 [Pararge aegeria aegeria]|uniref:Jg12554 protein n=1 Tax=Pararge aegeria aegeria TaxID=348720 RepID=A0A8S4S8G0_9NEOP|nr:jg12554 [Pararge aegeria aegeria]
MQSSIYLTIAFMACTTAVQIKVGPQVFPEAQSSFKSSQTPAKRYATREYTLYLTPDEIKSLQGNKNQENIENTQSSKESQSQQNEEEQQLKWYNKQFLPEAPQLEIRGLAAHDTSFQDQNSEINNQQGHYLYNNLYSEKAIREQQQDVQSLPEKENNFENYYNWQTKQEENTKKESDLQTGYKWKPYYTTSENQENIQFNEQLRKQWSSILEHNRIQLKSLAPVPKESEELKENEKSSKQVQLNPKSGIEKEIEDLLKEHRDFVLSQQSGITQVGAINQRPPILIHKEVTLTKHLPVPFVKRVKVPVPTPVLVPVPEPYEVKIPHPYPVLYKF